MRVNNTERYVAQKYRDEYHELRGKIEHYKEIEKNLLDKKERIDSNTNMDVIIRKLYIIGRQIRIAQDRYDDLSAALFEPLGESYYSETYFGNVMEGNGNIVG